MSKVTLATDVCLLALGTSYSLANIDEALGIILLVLNGLWILTKIGLKIYDIVKNKKSPAEIENEVEEGIEFVEDVRDFINDKENDIDGQNTDEE